MLEKRLYRSTADRKLCGVCAGIGEYLGIDPTFIRLLWLIFSMPGMGILAYIVCVVIIPENPHDDYTPHSGDNHN